MALVIGVVGATATGKSDLAIALAERLGGEVVGADASQLYRGMDIGTAKVPVGQRHGVPHHQVDVLDVTQEASVAAYQREARGDIEDVLGRGALPVVVEVPPSLSVRAVLNRLGSRGPTPRWSALEARLAAEGVATLLAELRAVDPRAAAAIEPNNGRRIVRALEVVALTGRRSARRCRPASSSGRPSSSASGSSARPSTCASSVGPGRCSTRGSWTRRARSSTSA